jgi:hypothetical protein
MVSFSARQQSEKMFALITMCQNEKATKAAVDMGKRRMGWRSNRRIVANTSMASLSLAHSY